MVAMVGLWLGTGLMVDGVWLRAGVCVRERVRERARLRVRERKGESTGRDDRACSGAASVSLRCILARSIGVEVTFAVCAFNPGEYSS